jgi:glycerol-1-phosphate dehydrogenase [NAD(P)+]
MSERIRCRFVSYADMKAKLLAAACPVSPGEIGLSTEQFLHGIRTAQLIRNRYTVLDLLYELGVLDEAMKKLTVML